MKPETEAYLKASGFTCRDTNNLLGASQWTAELEAGRCAIDVPHKATVQQIWILIYEAGLKAARERITAKWQAFSDSLLR